MKDNPKLIVKDTHKYGKGVFAKKDIKKGEFISSFEDGKVYFSDAEKAADLPNTPPKKIRDHAVQFSINLYMYNDKSAAHLVNHSCNPNCGIKKLFRIKLNLKSQESTNST